MRIALMGTRGVPARYGGFETCAEEVGRRLVSFGHDVSVYCRRPPAHWDRDTRSVYEGMRLIQLPATRRRALETLSHTALSVMHSWTQNYDAVLLFNAANAPFLPLLRVPTAIHVDGLEWKRDKWQGNGQRYFRVAERLAVRWADALIADAPGIADYYVEKFQAETELISYGAPLVFADEPELLDSLALTPRQYHLVVARFEPENHVHTIIEGYLASDADYPLVIVGSAPYSERYRELIDELVDSDPRVRMLGSVWDQRVLDQLYANCATYVHGHSVGGTNPSLLRAVGAGAAVIAYFVNFNWAVVGERGQYFTTAAELAAKLERAEADPAGTRERGVETRAIADLYVWDDVAKQYEQLCQDLVNGRSRVGAR